MYPTAIDFSELEKRGYPGEAFEELMMALFRAKGLEVSQSGRGADEGRDLFVWETLVGAISGVEKRKWLVWCRNKAKSNVSVAEKELPSIIEKCVQHDAHGFLVASTTLLSAGAQKMLDSLKNSQRNQYHIGYLVRYDIEVMILDNQEIFRHFFPFSYQRYRDAQNKFSITESELQSVVSGIYEKPLEANELRNLLAQTLLLGLSDIGQVRDIMEDQTIRSALQDIYRRLLGRDVDPSGHFTWGNYLRLYGIHVGSQMVERQITQLPEFAGRSGITVNYEFGEGPDFDSRFDSPASAMGWRIYHSQHCIGTLSRITCDSKEKFVQISSTSPQGIRAWFPDTRHFGFRKPICRLRCRFQGIMQVFFWFQDAGGEERWLCYQTSDTVTSDVDRNDPKYGVLLLELQPGHSWQTIEFRLADDFRDSFQTDFSAILKVCFHSQGSLDISRIAFSDQSQDPST